MKKLIRKGANEEAFAASVNSIINAAITSGITEAVTMLIEIQKNRESAAKENNWDVELLDSCLYTATDVENQETVMKLLSFGVDPNALGKEFGDALTASTNDGIIPIATALISRGADVNSHYGSALQAAAAQGHFEMVQLLIAHDAYINSFTDHHEACTALQAACNNGHIEIAERLLDKGANPNLGGGRYIGEDVENNMKCYRVFTRSENSQVAWIP
ncbi:hypothetical protein FHL15_010542 [Xylaria flabelliformis]|uniref:Uncharacterized protein n=1 Tax=Xylaria flabelliformis TaxID=2512241 RepID=A0A553HKW1_9PEZI|nr:hypothetical protein FHL15_010542 [Xylaria flabelliformis]